MITENNEKMRTSEKPNKLYIIRKHLSNAIQKCKFYWDRMYMYKIMVDLVIILAKMCQARL